MEGAQVVCRKELLRAKERSSSFFFEQDGLKCENKIFIRPEMCYTDCKQEIVASPAGEKWQFAACIR